MGHHANKSSEPKPSTKEKLKAIKKAKKLKLKEKRARLIIRNLPFETTEENLREHFSKYGEIDNIQLLKKDDGVLKGCGFVQFKLVQKAAKAKHHTNEKSFFGRNISVDFAQSKTKYDKTKSEKKTAENFENVKIKDEPIDVDELNDSYPEIKNEDDEKVEIKDELDEEEIKEENSMADETLIPKGDSDEENSNFDEESDEEMEVKEEQDEKRPKVESNDVTEGRTIFIKNVPFLATNEDVKQCMRQFGPLFYALVCVDKFTEHSKGTAFVKFQNAEDAEKALSAGTELTLMGNVLDCHRALGRNEIQQKAQIKNEEKSAPKDSRNLYLVKEGVILAGSKAAEGVSASDMAKRLQLEQYKTQMLRNLNMFISRDRLIVHNVPAGWDDRKLRVLFLKHSPKNAQIREVRIMRDVKNCDENGVGRSKEFGFVAYNRHEDALHALRSLNNNPNIFSAGKRPIVAFSIENKTMIKAKQRRLDKSKQNNPKCKDFDPSAKKQDDEKRQRYQAKAVHNDGGDNNKFAGVAAKPGVQKMRSRYNLKTQAQLHHDNLRKEKKKQKFAKKTFSEKKEEFTKQPKQKIKAQKKSQDNFSKMVADYKKKLTLPPVQKSKWYENT